MYISVLSNVMYINCKNLYMFSVMLYILIVKMDISVLSNVMCINCKNVYISFG